MTTLMAALPLVVVLVAMLAGRWATHRAGLAGWLAGLVVALTHFGLTAEVFWVSQVRGALLSAYVLVVLWAALWLYALLEQAGGIRAVAAALEAMIGDRAILALLLAWAFSGMLEGLAGFGLPVAIVAPLLAAIGVPPVRAVAAAAVGHAWAVTFGGMGITWQTLVLVVGLDRAVLGPPASVLLGLACLLCGWAAASILGSTRHVGPVLLIGATMAVTQYVLVTAGLSALGAFVAGAAGLALGVARYGPRRVPAAAASPALRAAVLVASVLVLAMTAVSLDSPLRRALDRLAWQPMFPGVTTALGVHTPAGPGQAWRPLTHPATAILVVGGLAAWWLPRRQLLPADAWRQALLATWRAAAPASVGVIVLVGLAVLMDHCGMTVHLARSAVATFGAGYPLLSPLVGTVGAFATGSNNSSNVLLGTLQRDAATLLGTAPAVLVAAQTAGGALGSMVAPAKLGVGGSTLGLAGQEGQVLRLTLPYGVLLPLILGAVTLLWRS